MSLIRSGGAADLAEIASIQSACPEAAQWPCADYLGYDLRVAIVDGHIAGFLVARATGPDEAEVLNLAVAPGFRRRGIGRELLSALREHYDCDLFLEVRASNEAARKFYEAFGFQRVSLRPQYYESPPETAIVMKFHPC
jgi:ribosomal-protein-alanine N-acetyltransferase